MNREFFQAVLMPLKIAYDQAKANGKIIKTNWSVITGAPLSGKTTVINQLASQGYKTTPDFGRIAIEKRIREGKDKTTARSNYIALQQEISDTQNKHLKTLDPLEKTFLDYGPPDNLAFLFYRNKVSRKSLINHSIQFQLQRCYILSPLKVDPTQDQVRIEDELARSEIRQFIEELYLCLETPIIHIKDAPPLVRVNQITATEAAASKPPKPEPTKVIRPEQL